MGERGVIYIYIYKICYEGDDEMRIASYETQLERCGDVSGGWNWTITGGCV